MGSIFSLTQVLLCIGGLVTLGLLVFLTLAFTHQQGPFKPANEPPPHGSMPEKAQGRVNEARKNG